MIQNSLNELPAIDHDVLVGLKRIMGDELQSMFIQHFIDGVPPQLEVLKASISDMDIPKIHQQSHRLKGESLQMGANQFAAICQLIENLAKNSDSHEKQQYYNYLTELGTEFLRVKISLQQENSHEN